MKVYLIIFNILNIYISRGQAESLYEKPKLKKTKRQKIPTLPENECDSPAPMVITCH